jgi:hypothetical protein
VLSDDFFCLSYGEKIIARAKLILEAIEISEFSPSPTKDMEFDLALDAELEYAEVASSELQNLRPRNNTYETSAHDQVCLRLRSFELN